MHLDLTLDFETQEVEIVYDDSISLRGYWANNNRKYSGFNKISDETEHDFLKQVCTLALNHVMTNSI